MPQSVGELSGSPSSPRHVDEQMLAEFWRAKAAGDKSEQLLRLTARIIDACEGHYTVWQYRRHLVDVLKVDLRGELAFVRQYTVERPKNYQLWRHREAIVLRLLQTHHAEEMRSVVAAEREDLSLVLIDEPKNYHAWQYRQWLVRQTPSSILLGEEAAFTKQALFADPFNNSAWNHRFFVLTFIKTADYATAMPHWTEELELVGRLLGMAEGAHIENHSILNYCHALPLLYAEPGLAAVRSATQDLFSSFPWHHRLYQKLFLTRE